MAIKNDISVTDPRGLRIVLRGAVANKRDAEKKHLGPDNLSPEDAMDVVENPHVIQQSATVQTREIYYRYEEELGRPPYKRAVIDRECIDPQYDGECISWSRYKGMVSGNIVYVNKKG